MKVVKQILWKLALLVGFSLPYMAVAETLPEGLVWIDVRSDGEYQSGHVDHALNIPHTEIKDRILEAVPDKDAPVYLYCRSGRRSGFALKALQELGYTNAINVGGYSDAKFIVQKNEAGLETKGPEE